MKTARSILVLSLAAGLCVSASVQAFCFTKSNNNARSHNYYNYPMPAIGFMPAPYYAYPYSSLAAGTRYEPVRPMVMPEPPNNSPIESVDVWRQ